MKIGVLKEIHVDEKRVATTPSVTEKLIKLGFEVIIESGAGAGANYSDQHYEAAGASIGKLTSVVDPQRKSRLPNS